MRLEPTVVISLDKELVWGSFDHTPADAWGQRYPDARGIVHELLALFDEFEIPVTWAVVGHLFLSSCARGPDGRAHPEIVRPRHEWFPRDWLADDPCSDAKRAPLFYAPDLVDAILAVKTRHEIGSHSFSHIVFGDPGCSREAAKSDLQACIDAAEKRGLELRSFVFPRNVEGHHDVLRELGFVAYRGEEPTRYRAWPRSAQRAAHLAAQALAIDPPVVTPTETLPGLWNIPGSMLFLHRGGVRRAIPFASRIHRAKRGIQRAIREKKIFHLWFHPFNMSDDRDGMFAALREVLRLAAEERAKDRLTVRTLGGIASEVSRRAQLPYVHTMSK